jgi:TolB-like protein/DNA-binding winged helix-turn-helix (wHTH) protein/thioredoxin-like negative regulator of GroEL
MPANRSYSFGEYTLDLKRGALLRAGLDVKLRPKSFEVLRVLLERHGQLVTKEELLNAVWGHAVVTDGAVGQCLVDLRRVMGDESQQFIRTVPRRGYIFDSPVAESDDVPRSDNGDALPSASPQTHDRAFLTRRTLGPAALAALAVVAVLWSVWPTRDGDAIASLHSRAQQAPHNSIAVLPFVDLSAEQDQQYFSEGISEEILNLLAQAPNLQVIARTSSFSFKGRNADIAEIAAKLNVAYVLEGSVRKSGGHVRITAQFVDAANSAHLWSETYDRELQDVLAVQSEIAARVSEALKVTLTDPKTSRAATAPNPEAHERFLRAQFFYNRRAPGDVERAKGYYEQALQIDPRFARAWEGLAGVYGVQIGAGEISRESGLAKRAEAVKQALAFGPNLAEAHIRAAAHYFEIGERRRAEEHTRKAYALDRDNPRVLSEYAQTLAWEGRFDEAVEGLRRVVMLDPVSPLQRNVLASYLMAAGRYDEARAERLKELELNPAAKPDIDIDLGQILILQHRFAEARELIGQWPEGDNRTQGLAMVEHALGRSAAAEVALQKLTEGTHAGVAVRLAEIYAQRGDVEEAFRWMETARVRLGPDAWLSPEWRWCWQLRMSAFLRPLHGDSRWHVTSTVRFQEKRAA